MALASTNVGSTVNATAASTGSASNMVTPATTSITATPKLNGSGAKIANAASTSAFALLSSWPVGCRRCQANGSRRYCRLTARR